MLAKEISYNSGKFHTLISYIRTGADKLSDFSFFHNLPAGTSTQEIADAFEYNHSFCKRVRKKAAHIVLSFHPDSTPYLDDKTLYDLTAAYINLRAPMAMAFAQKHVEKRHVHIHVCLSGNLLYQDKSIRLDKSSYIQRMKELESLQMERYPALNSSLVYQHQKEKKLHISPRETQKQEVIQLLSELADQAQDLDEFFTLIAQHCDIEAYSYRNRINGVYYKKKKYRFKKHIPERYSALEQLQRWKELSKGDKQTHEVER